MGWITWGAIGAVISLLAMKALEAVAPKIVEDLYKSVKRLWPTRETKLIKALDSSPPPDPIKVLKALGEIRKGHAEGAGIDWP